MRIINQTRNTVISENVIVPKSLLDRTIGLLRYKTPTAMLLRTHFGIHTLDMKYPIDVLVLDKQNHVVALNENLKPNRIFFWNPKYETVLELPQGTIKKTKTEVDDVILL